MCSGNAKKSSTQRQSLAIQRMNRCFIVFSLPTGRAAAAAAAGTSVAPAALEAGWNGTPNSPIPEYIFVIFVHTMLSTFQEVMQTRLSLAHNNMLRALLEPVFVGEQTDRRSRFRLLES